MRWYAVFAFHGKKAQFVCQIMVVIFFHHQTYILPQKPYTNNESHGWWLGIVEVDGKKVRMGCGLLNMEVVLKKGFERKKSGPV